MWGLLLTDGGWSSQNCHQAVGRRKLTSGLSPQRIRRNHSPKDMSPTQSDVSVEFTASIAAIVLAVSPLRLWPVAMSSVSVLFFFSASQSDVTSDGPNLRNRRIVREERSGSFRSRRPTRSATPLAPACPHAILAYRSETELLRRFGGCALSPLINGEPRLHTSLSMF